MDGYVTSRCSCLYYCIMMQPKLTWNSICSPGWPQFLVIFLPQSPDRVSQNAQILLSFKNRISDYLVVIYMHAISDPERVR